MTAICEKVHNEDLGNYRPLNLTLVLGKVLKQIILSAFAHVQDNQGTRPSQYGFLKGRPCIINLIFYAQVTCLVNERHSVDVVCLDCSKVLSTVLHSILLEKLTACVLDLLFAG